MVTVRSRLAVALIGLVALLAGLETAAGLHVLGWTVGLTCGVVASAVLDRGRASGAFAIGAGDLVTLTRATLACGVAALVANSFLQHSAVEILVAFTVVALLLDAVDGWVARRTRTVTTFGARFDGEVDAFLILVLSVYVAHSVGSWVLAIGVARYAFAVAGWGLPWLRGLLPPRYWRKVVAAIQGIVLAATAADVMPRPWTYAALGVALALLTESFGRDVLWLWRRRFAALAGSAGPTDPVRVRVQ